MGSMFFNKGGIVLPKPSQVGRTKIRNLYEDGYPASPPRLGRPAKGPIVRVYTTADPWWDPGNGYNLTTTTITKLPGDGGRGGDPDRTGGQGGGGWEGEGGYGPGGPGPDPKLNCAAIVVQRGDHAGALEVFCGDAPPPPPVGSSTAKEEHGDHERWMIYDDIPGGGLGPQWDHFDGPVTGVLVDLCPDPSETDDSAWSEDDCE